ncbi:MAG: Hsp70 family protein [Defluviitaleaceae bacterium]|nr:Hsp70 family protein [Defluviitaleaceae bacterium]
MANLSLDMERGLLLGIDFGTTNSVVSIYNFEEGNAITIPIDGSNILPTVIQFEQDKEDEDKLSKVFGLEAKGGAIIYPESTILGVKRLLGLDEKVAVYVDEKEYLFLPEQIAGEIIGYLKQKADEYVREELNIESEFSGCVITVPANSTDKQKQMTKKAAIFGGFDEDSVFLRLEPAAAAISYAVNEVDDKTVLVYDFGGGTFDACILAVQITGEGEPAISILSTYGDNSLGGNDVDVIAADMIYEEFKSLTEGAIDLFDENADDGISKRQKKIAVARLMQIATQTKERFSHSQTAKVVLAPFVREPKIVNINMEITREEFLNHKRVNKLWDSDEVFEKFKGKSVNDIIDMTIDCVDKCLKAAKLEPGDVNEVFTVGGSSSLCNVSERLIGKFGKEPYKAKVSPALSISQGAAHYCNMIMMPAVKGPKVSERTIHPLGLEIAGRRFLTVVEAGMDIPVEGLEVEAPELLMTNFDNVSSMAIVVYEDTQWVDGELKYVNENGMKRLAGTSLRGIPQAPKGQEKVRVIFSVGQDNILKVSAKSISDLGAGTRLMVDDLYTQA